MLAKVIYRLRTYLHRKQLEAANPRIAELNRAERMARKQHKPVKRIQAERSAIVHRAIGWRGAR